VSPARLWLLSIWLRRRGLRAPALWVKKLNSVLYHNSLAPGASVSPDIRFGHHGFGTVVHSNVSIGRRVVIWHNVTIAVRASTPSPHGIVIEDDVSIGANSVIVSPYEGSLRIGRGARIGAGAVVSRDVPAGATVISAPARFILRQPDGAENGGAVARAAPDEVGPDPADAQRAEAERAGGAGEA
jgi:serine O-acetyltransferase